MPGLWTAPGVQFVFARAHGLCAHVLHMPAHVDPIDMQVSQLNALNIVDMLHDFRRHPTNPILGKSAIRARL